MDFLLRKASFLTLVGPSAPVNRSGTVHSAVAAHEYSYDWNYWNTFARASCFCGEGESAGCLSPFRASLPSKLVPLSPCCTAFGIRPIPEELIIKKNRRKCGRLPRRIPRVQRFRSWLHVGRNARRFFHSIVTISNKLLRTCKFCPRFCFRECFLGARLRTSEELRFDIGWILCRKLQWMKYAFFFSISGLSGLPLSVLDESISAGKWMFYKGEYSDTSDEWLTCTTDFSKTIFIGSLEWQVQIRVRYSSIIFQPASELYLPQTFSSKFQNNSRHRPLTMSFFLFALKISVELFALPLRHPRNVANMGIKENAK